MKIDQTILKETRYIAAWVLILLVAVYFWFYRGICVYENGKLRVFQGRITTVKDGWVEEMSIEKQKEIASVLDKVTELIALRKEQLTKLDQLVVIVVFSVLHKRFDKCFLLGCAIVLTLEMLNILRCKGVSQTDRGDFRLFQRHHTGISIDEMQHAGDTFPTANIMQ